MTITKCRTLALSAAVLATLVVLVSWQGSPAVHAQQLLLHLHTGAHELHLGVGERGAGQQPVAAQERPRGGQIRRCVENTLGRLPSTPEDMTQDERSKVFQACPGSEGNLGALFFGSLPDSEETILSQIRSIDDKLRKLESDTRREMQKESDGLNREQEDREKQLKDNLQKELNQVDQQRLDLQEEFEVKAKQKGWDARKRAEKGKELRRLLAGLDEERFNLEQRTNNQIQREVNLLAQDNAGRERQLRKDMEQNRSRLERRRSELEAALQDPRGEKGRSEQVALDRDRQERERRLEEDRLRQQRQLDQQRLNQQRQSIEMERQLEQDRLNQTRELDQQRIDQERRALEREKQIELDRQRLEAERSNPAVTLKGLDSVPSQVIEVSQPAVKLPTRGFFSNSASGEVSDIDRLLDPTALAVLGILLTLVATSLSLVKGS